jgi:hypothetical protein
MTASQAGIALAGEGEVFQPRVTQQAAAVGTVHADALVAKAQSTVAIKALVGRIIFSAEVGGPFIVPRHEAG